MTTKTRKAWLAERRKRFRQALLEGDLTLAAFCERHDYSRNHLNEVLTGKRASRVVDALLAKFIQQELGITL